MEKKKIIFLYTELATYFLACIKALLQHPNIEVYIVRWPLNKEAPFNFSFSDKIKIFDRSNFASPGQLLEFIKEINPSAIYCSGWMDKFYLKVCKQYKNKIPVIVGFDNQWKGSLKQYIATLISPFKILNHFTHCWIPGSLQYEYAVRLGFKKQNILTGFYCCDFDLFYNQYLTNKEQKQKQFPKRFIYVGRYVEHKGIKDLWQAFIDLQLEQHNEWELWCFGTGDVAPVEHPKIKHFGFVQPEAMPAYIKECGVFVLPSLFEPWGVVVHEFAAAGFPIICSDEVGARTAFVENNFNGYIYKAGNSGELKEALKKIMNKKDNELFEMGERSVEKAKQITPEKWADELMKLLQ
jgi:glycosyltransferase involved in cell wall biosynthesis